ncbi:HET-domain-containing protein [Hypoxylon fuscum]|nr:HET-domain-containing protein [Hypoxylon fuscum]
MAENYVYTSLSQADRQIRLLTIGAGTWSDKIECNLQVASLDDSPCYEALSYVWGDTNNTKSISVNSRTLEVTENLYLALRRMRHTESPRVMWIDAVCINEEDNAEKSTQVAMMGTIFAKCQKAILWLGEDPEVIENATDVLPPVSVDAQRAFQLLRILGQDKHLDELPCFLTEMGEDYYTIIKSPSFEEHFESLKAITYVPWWNRIWIIQEMVLPRQVEFAFASETCEGEIIHNIRDQFVKHVNTCCAKWWFGIMKRRSLYSLLFDMISLQAPLVLARRSMEKGDKLSLSQLRSEFWSFEATDQRDLIYGLLGLVTDWGEDAQPLVPDYSLSPTSVICNAFLRSIRQSRNLEALEGGRWLNDNGGLPTWIPDMRVHGHSRSTAMRTQTNKLHVQSLFHASSNLPCTEVDLIDDSVLRVQSLKFDTIKIVNDMISHRRDCVDVMQEWMDATGIRDWPVDPPPEASVESQFWRALIRDCAELRSNTPPHFRRATQYDYYSMRDFLTSVASGKVDDPPDGFRYIHHLAHSKSVMVLTESGMVGIGSFKCQEGDEIHVILGSRLPYVLRPEPNAPLDGGGKRNDEGVPVGTSGLPILSYTVIGDMFLHGIMDGEVVRDSKLDDIRTIDLL